MKIKLREMNKQKLINQSNNNLSCFIKGMGVLEYGG
jgi:hypothetical protein